MTGTPTHRSWLSMLARCSNPRAPDYPRYGGRGITVCERWKKFVNFYEDMGTRPDERQLDRSDNNGNYEPGNCRWATREEQGRNKRNNRILIFRGESKPLVEWAEIFRIKRSVVSLRLNQLGWSIEKALTTPVQTRR